MYKRSEIRRQINLPIEIAASFADSLFCLRSHNLSSKGLFVESSIMPNLGEFVVCSFELDKQYCFFGQVKRVNLLRRKSDTEIAGFGIKFVDASVYEQQSIFDSLKGLPPPVPAKRRDGVVIRKIIRV